MDITPVLNYLNKKKKEKGKNIRVLACTKTSY